MGVAVKDETARLSAPFSVYGGKKYLAGKLVRYIPQHRVYVEAFMGAASLLFAKGPSPVETLGDVDADKIRTFRFLRDHSENARAALLEKDWAPSRATFTYLKEHRPYSEIDWIYRELYLRWNSFGCRGDSWAFNNAAAGWERYLKVRMPAYKERLRGVNFLTQSWEKTVAEFDAPDTFFYLDPPYIGTANERALHFKEPSAQDLLAVLSRVRGKWLMSNSAHPSLLTAFRNYHVRQIRVPTQIDQMHRGALRDRVEYLIANYKLPDAR